MAVYNPYDQVIFDDPAYLTDANKVKEQLQEETRGIADIIARTAGPIAGLITDPEAYQQTLDQEQRNKQILESLNITNRQLNKDEMERAKAAGYDPLTPGQALGKISGFMYSDLVKGSENIRAGVDYYDLPDNERTGVAMGIIDLADIALLPAVFKKLATLGVRKFGKTNLKTMAQDPELQKQFPAETQEILSITGGGFTPAGVMREAEMGGSAPIRTGYGEITDKIKNYVKDRENVTVQQIAKDLNINESNIREAYRVSPEIKSKIKKSKAGYDYDKIRDFVNSQETTSYEEIKNATGISSDNIRGFFSENPTYQNKVFNLKKKDFGRGPESVSSGLKYLFDNAPQDKLFTKKEILDEYGIVKQTLNRFLKKNDKYIEQIDPDVLRENWKPMGAGSDNPTYNRSKIIQKYKDTLGIKGEAERKFFDGIIRSSRPEYFGYDYKDFTKGEWADFVMKDFQDNFAMTNWKDEFATDLNTYKTMESDRKKANKQIKDYFNEMQKKYPEKLKDLNYKDFELQIAHNFPLGATARKGELIEAGGLSGAIRLSYGKTNLVSHKQLEELLHQNLMELKKLNLGKITTDVIPKEYNELFAKIDKKAKDLGTVIYFKLGDKMQKVGMEKTPSPEALVSSFKNHLNKIVRQSGETYAPRKTKKTKGFTTRNIIMTNKGTKEYDKDIPPGITGPVADLFNKGGPVKMAMGGDPLQNINQQQFSPDPAVDQDYFQEAVDSGNLQAANLLNLFKVFNKPKAMATPSNVKKVEEARDPIPAPTGSQEIAPLPAGKQDFFFKSFFLDQLNNQNAPKASTPQGWREFLIKGRKVPEAEMMDTGILQYLEDTEKFFPNKKITKQDLETLYDTSPLGNLEVRVKEIKAPGFDEGQFTLDQGRPRHKGAGNAAIDQAADDYFEVVVNVPQLPGQEKVFVNSGHFAEPNVLGFTRVGTYKNADNQTVAVIQEMQTDMLTEVRKEQERLFAMVNALKRQRANLVNQVEQARNAGMPGNAEYTTNKLRQFDQKYPESLLNDLAQDNLIQPFPNIVAKELIPEKTRNLNAIQDDINKLSMANVEQYADPAYKTKIFDLAQEQTKILDDLMSMNRSSNYQEKLKDFKVPSTSNREELQRIGQTDTYLPSDYNMKKLESFPPIPFNKQADYVDLLIKSTIKAAKQKGIDRVAIMPADIGANPRWGKSSDEAKKKFQNLYDKVGVQQLKNIAKKYDGTLNVEKIMDPSKTNRGLTFLNKNPDGEFQFLKQTETKKNVSDAERDAFYDTEITRIASGVNEPGTIVLTREIAPGQMMDYYLVEGRGDATDVGYRMIPLKEGESADDALIKIVEYNPSAIDMYTISFDPSKLEEPMYLFKKKSGGTIDKDSLVSITDIYGEYGR